jgi:hypothetical protein
MALQEALAGQPESSAAGTQINAQSVGLDEPDASSTHSGLAVVPGGTSLEHSFKKPHFGEQNDPLTPVIWMAVSPFWQGPAFGSS